MNAVDSQNGSVGLNVWWTVPGTVVDGALAQECVRNNGFSEKEMKMPTRRTEMVRAADSVGNRRTKEDKTVLEKCSEGAETATYGILKKGLLSTEQADYHQTTTVKLEKASGTVTAEGPQGVQVMDALRRYEGAITDQDIRAFLTRTIRTARGIPKRPSGGIYFVPVQYASIVLAAQKSLADMGTKARIYTERVVNGVQERQNVWGSVQEDVDDQINKLLDEVSKITKRASAVRTKQAKLGEIKELAKMYQDMLGEEARYEDLTAKFAAAERAISAKMVEVQEQVNAAPESCDGASVETEVLQLAVA